MHQFARVFLVSFAFVSACAPAAAPSVAQDPRAAAAAMDKRAPVPLTPMMAQHQKEMMRDHLVAIGEITAAVSTDDWASIEAAGGRLGSSPQTAMMCEHMGAGSPDFTERGLAFHTTADGIVAAAGAKDHDGVVTALIATLDACTACHAQFRQGVVSDADYEAASGSTPPHPSTAPSGGTSAR